MPKVSQQKELMQQRNHMGNAFIFMVRYALSRKTSADMATVSALRSNWDIIPSIHRDIILKEIESELNLFDEDPWLWQGFINDIKSGKLTAEKYSVNIVPKKKKPMTQQAGEQPPVVLVIDNETGNHVAVDYMRTSKKNLDEAIRILVEMEEN